MKSYLTKFKGGISAWLSRDCNTLLVCAFVFWLWATFSDNGTAPTIMSTMCIFLWSLAIVIRQSLVQVLAGLFHSLGKELKQYPEDFPETPKRDS